MKYAILAVALLLAACDSRPLEYDRATSEHFALADALCAKNEGLVIFSVILVAHWIDIRSYKNGIVKGAVMYREALLEQIPLPSKPPTKE